MTLTDKAATGSGTHDRECPIWVGGKCRCTTYVPATSAAAREFCESYWPQAHKNTPWEYVAGNKEIMYELMAAYAAQQTAAKDAALEAAERERDSLREALTQIETESYDPQAVLTARRALKAGKDGQQ